MTEARQQRAEAHIDGQAAVCPYAAVLPLRRPTRISYTSRFCQGAPHANLCGRRSRCLRTKIRQVSSILAALSLRLALAYTSRAAIRVADLTSSRGWMSSEASCGDADLKLEPDCGKLPVLDSEEAPGGQVCTCGSLTARAEDGESVRVSPRRGV